MDKMLYLNELYEYYGELFTDKQKNYYEDYYFNDLSLSEIADNYGVSRNAIYNQLKIVENKLIEYENILHLRDNKKKIVGLLKERVDSNTLNKIEEIL